MDLSNINVRMRVLMLKKIAEIVKYVGTDTQRGRDA